MRLGAKAKVPLSFRGGWAEAAFATFVWLICGIGGGVEMKLAFRSTLSPPIRPLVFLLGLAVFRWVLAGGILWFAAALVRDGTLEVNTGELTVGDSEDPDPIVIPRFAVRTVALGEALPKLPAAAIRQMFSFGRPFGPIIGARSAEMQAYWYSICHSSAVLTLLRLRARPNLVVLLESGTPLRKRQSGALSFYGAGAPGSSETPMSALVAQVENPDLAVATFSAWGPIDRLSAEDIEVLTPTRQERTRARLRLTAHAVLVISALSSIVVFNWG